MNGQGLFTALSAVSSAPAAPTNITVTPASLSLTVSWTSALSATSYSVLRSTTPSGGFATIASGLTSATYTDPGLTYGVTYYYEVTATNAIGTSSVSTVASGTPYPAVPGAPTNFTAVLTP